jgi:hypothetical protein
MSYGSGTCAKCNSKIELTYEQIWFDDYSKPLLCEKHKGELQ